MLNTGHRASSCLSILHIRIQLPNISLLALNTFKAHGSQYCESESWLPKHIRLLAPNILYIRLMAPNSYQNPAPNTYQTHGSQPNTYQTPGSQRPKHIRLLFSNTITALLGNVFHSNLCHYRKNAFKVRKCIILILNTIIEPGLWFTGELWS